jgi:serine/threonine-protein kinase RsbW
MSPPRWAVSDPAEKSLKRTAVFPGDFCSLKQISSFVAPAVSAAGFDDQTTYAVLLAVDEASSNIIEHAYGAEGRGDIQCTVEVSQDALVITLQDWGDPFDPSMVPNPDFSVPLQELEARGAGIVLIQRIMDEVRFESTSDQGNLLTLIKRKERLD